ncbi:hypothetical protein NST02_08465 [Robertmurraya sp. FSL W8-0741]|nr:hypothetical protein [Robertmurraya siralis]
MDFVFFVIATMNFICCGLVFSQAFLRNQVKREQQSAQSGGFIIV